MSLYSTPLTVPFNDQIFSEELIRDLETDKQLVDRIRKQRLRAQQLKEGLERKDADLQKMTNENKELSKLKPYFQKFNVMKDLLDQTLSKLEAKENENNKLTVELQRMMIQVQNFQRKLSQSDKNRLSLMKERTQLERINSEIQDTFIQYKTECRNKQTQLLARLQKAYRHVKDQKRLIDQLDETRKDLSLYKRRCEELQNMKKLLEDQKVSLEGMLCVKDKQLTLAKKDQNSNTLNSKSQQMQKYHLSVQNQQLKQTLLQREKQLQKSRRFNHQLSIQYDSSVNKNLEFQKQLYEYRRENHELKKQISLYIEKQQYQQYYKKEMLNQSLESEQLDHLSSKHI